MIESCMLIDWFMRLLNLASDIGPTFNPKFVSVTSGYGGTHINSYYG